MKSFLWLAVREGVSMAMPVSTTLSQSLLFCGLFDSSLQSPCGSLLLWPMGLLCQISMETTEKGGLRKLTDSLPPYSLHGDVTRSHHVPEGSGVFSGHGHHSGTGHGTLPRHAGQRGQRSESRSIFVIAQRVYPMRECRLGTRALRGTVVFHRREPFFKGTLCIPLPLPHLMQCSPQNGGAGVNRNKHSCQQKAVTENGWGEMRRPWLYFQALKLKSSRYRAHTPTSTVWQIRDKVKRWTTQEPLMLRFISRPFCVTEKNTCLLAADF